MFHLINRYSTSELKAKGTKEHVIISKIERPFFKKTKFKNYQEFQVYILKESATVSSSKILLML